MPCFSWFCNKTDWTQDIFYTSSPYHAWLKPMGHLNVPRWQIMTKANGSPECTQMADQNVDLPAKDCLLGLLTGTAYWDFFPYFQGLWNSPSQSFQGLWPVISRTMKQSQSFQGLWSSPRHFKDYVWSCMKSFHSLGTAFLSFIVLCNFLTKR